MYHIGKKYHSVIFIKGFQRCIGRFYSEIQAAAAYNGAVDLYWSGEGYKNSIDQVELDKALEADRVEKSEAMKSRIDRLKSVEANRKIKQTARDTRREEKSIGVIREQPSYTKGSEWIERNKRAMQIILNPNYLAKTTDYTV